VIFGHSVAGEDAADLGSHQLQRLAVFARQAVPVRRASHYRFQPLSHGRIVGKSTVRVLALRN